MIIKNSLRFPALFFILLLSGFYSFSQEIRILQGQVLADSLGTEGIHVVNLNLKTGITTGAEGKFKIGAKKGDTIFFSSIQFENRKILVETSDIENSKITVKLFPSRNELEEIRITDLKLSGHLDNDLPKINYFQREKYGIPYPKKQLSLNEKRLYTANAGVKSRWSYIGVLLGGVPLEVVINDINGRTKYLRAVVERERMQEFVKKGIEVLGNHFFVDNLGIPGTEIENFVFYCSEFPEFEKLVTKSQTLDLIEFYQLKKEEFINLREINASQKN